MTTWRDFTVSNNWLTCPLVCEWNESLQTISLGDLQWVAQGHLDIAHFPRKPSTPRPPQVLPRGNCQICGEEKTLDSGGFVYSHMAKGRTSHCVGSGHYPKKEKEDLMVNSSTPITITNP